MSTNPSGTVSLLTHKQWVDALRRHVCAEVEPAVRRSEPRFDVVIGGCRLMFKDQAGTDLAVPVTLIQVSASGVMLRSHVEPPIGQLVTLECPLYAEGAVVAGVVAHCTSTVGAHKVGVELRFAEMSNRKGQNPPKLSHGKPRTPLTTRPPR